MQYVVFFFGLAAAIILFLLARGLLPVLTAVQNRRRGDRRWAELALWAQGNSFSYHPEEDPSLWIRFRSFRCLQESDTKYGYGVNVMDGVFGGRRVCAFDYHSEEGMRSENGDEVAYLAVPLRDFSAVVVEASLPLEALLISPAGHLSDADPAGLEDIHFESIAFNKKYCVQSSDRRWAYAVLSQKTIELMLQHPSFIIDLQGSQVMARWEKKRFSPQEFQSALTVATGILDNLPPDVVERLRSLDSPSRSR